MPRTPGMRHADLRRGFIPIPKDMNKVSHKIEIISDGITYDVTDFTPNMKLERIATVGLSNFLFIVYNNGGRYKHKFAAGNIVNIYYNFKTKDLLSTIRFRGYIDGAFNNLNLNEGYSLIIEGRDAPSSGNNEHFADTDITIKFNNINNLDCWAGVSGTQDNEGNFEGGVLYNSGL